MMKFFVSFRGDGVFCHVCCFPLLFVNCILIISSACLMAGGDAIAGASLWDRMVRHEPDVFIPRGSFYEGLLLDTHRQWTAASVSIDMTVINSKTAGVGCIMDGSGSYFNFLN